MTLFQPVLVFALALLPTVVRGLASCCVNSTSGVDFVDDCVCLVDNTQLSGQILAAGETRLYHWVLGMNNSELVSGSIRGNLTFEVSTAGRMHIHVHLSSREADFKYYRGKLWSDHQ